MLKTPALLCALGLLLGACSQPPDQLGQIQREGVLRVITRNGPTTYYIGAEGPQGMEYELAARFADYLGVRLEIISAVRPGDIVPVVINGRADLAAAGLAATELGNRDLRFGPAYMQITRQLVYRRGTSKPADFDKLKGRLGIIKDSSQETLLEQLKKTQYPALTWATYANTSQHELLERVANGELDYAIADSNEIAQVHAIFPKLQVAFDVNGALALAWAFDRRRDPSLVLAAQDFFQQLARDSVLDRLRNRYYGHIRQHTYVDARSFLKHISTRLPALRPHFQSAAAVTGFDWRLLAALSYQESHWHPEAESPTGVRGLMMLTLPTAKRVGVEDRTDAVQSIHGGARYLREVMEKIPERISHPDRLWLALAAYNVGFGHLEDARRITEDQRADPDDWHAVRERLPLLSQEKWYENTKHGYARGREPVQFVRNIRHYYDVLVWLDQYKQAAEPVTPQITSPVL